ncbi:MAG: zinc ribbon domain-containing protein [Candidatus Thorarchaeota archaeon]|jgi:hypothetical protein
MVRQLAFDFLYHKKGNKLVVEKEEVAHAMAFILAESNKKGKAKLKFLSPITVPFWIVQISDTNSIVVSAIGESSVQLDLSEDTATGPVRRILNTEISRFEDIPDGVDKAIPLLRNVEPKVQQLRNVQEPSLFVKHGDRFGEVDPNENLNSLALKIDAQRALTISEEFQAVIQAARQRYGTMEELQKITKEKLTDQIKVMDNVITADLGRWEKRLGTQEDSSRLRIKNLQERLSDKVYRLKDKHEKDKRAVLAEFVRETVEIERFFAQIIEDIKTTREQLSHVELEEALEKYRFLADQLGDTIPTYTDIIDSIDDIADASTGRVGDLDAKLTSSIRDEEDSIDSQIKTLQNKVEDMGKERTEKKIEYQKTQKKVIGAIDRIDGLVEKRVNSLKTELESIQRLTLKNDSVRGLTPLTLVHIRTWVATYTSGKPVVFPPVILPVDKLSIPHEHQPFDAELEVFVRKSVNKQTRDSASFKTSFRSACDTGNILQIPESIKSFSKGIGNLWTRQLLKEGVREKLEPLYKKLVGRCPECGSEITSNSKFCPDCGKSLK